jgi:hypothetical protein
MTRCKMPKIAGLIEGAKQKKHSVGFGPLEKK